mmetsp:Transcript_40340/g.35588  ORF Transcript_40340/g.35588 Transcript_40340/m.35588 type:complete len:200 (-) Transcript_40340:125-724(-)
MSLLIIFIFISTYNIDETNAKRQFKKIDTNNQQNNEWHHHLHHNHPYHHNTKQDIIDKYRYNNYIYSGKEVKYGDSVSSDAKYSDKQQVVAFMLSLFIFGAGRIYVEHYIIGSIQLALLQLLLLLICAATIASCCFQSAFGSSNQNGQNTPTGNIRQLMLLSIFWVPLGLIVGIWWIHDIASFGMNHITDANGLQLQPW